MNWSCNLSFYLALVKCKIIALRGNWRVGDGDVLLHLWSPRVIDFDAQSMFTASYCTKNRPGWDKGWGGGSLLIITALKSSNTQLDAQQLAPLSLSQRGWNTDRHVSLFVPLLRVRFRIIVYGCPAPAVQCYKQYTHWRHASHGCCNKGGMLARQLALWPGIKMWCLWVWIVALLLLVWRQVHLSVCVGFSPAAVDSSYHPSSRCSGQHESLNRP